MPTTTLSNLDSELLSTTALVAAKEARDLDYEVTPLCTALKEIHGEGGPSADGGFRWIIRYDVGDHSTETEEVDGYEQMNLDFAGVSVPAVITPFGTNIPVGISLREQDLNAGEKQIIEMFGNRTKKTMAYAKRRWEQQSWQDGVSGYSNMITLNGIDDTTAGLLEEQAAGTQDSTYGGFDKSTYAASQGAQNQAYDCAGSFNTGGLAGLFRLTLKARNRSQGEKKNMRWYLSESCAENYLRVMQGQERYVRDGSSDKAGDAIRVEFAISGVAGVSNQWMPNGGTNTTANPWSAALIDHESLFFRWMKATRDGYFGMSDIQPVGNGYNVNIGVIHIGGQWWIDSWASNAVMIDGDAF
tara:strand:- start:14 stop:1084 length:1071 start_codon:yes stop_codon:yes gene_type:complete